MTSFSNAPIVTTVPLAGKKFVLGQTDNMFSPVKIETYWSTSTTTNPVIAGYAAFTNDGVIVSRGAAGYTLNNFIGFTCNKYLDEYDPGTNPSTVTMGDKFTVPVISQGAIWVYNSSAITLSNDIATGIKIIISSTNNAYPVGSIMSGADPSNTTTLDISNITTLRVGAGNVGDGVLIEVIRP